MASPDVIQTAKAVEANPGTAAGTTITATFASPVTAGSSLWVVFNIEQGTTQTVTCSDNLNGAWGTILDQIVLSGDSTDIGHFSFDNSAAGSGPTPGTVTVTFPSSQYRSCVVYEIGPTAGLDRHTGQSQTTVATTTDLVSSGSVTPTANGLAVSLSVDAANPHAPNAGTGATSDGTHFIWEFSPFGRFQHKTAISGVPIAGTFTATVAGDDYITMLAIFKDSIAATASQGADSPKKPRVIYVFNRKVPPFWPPARELGLSTQNQAAAQQTLTLAAAQGSFAFTGQIAVLAKAIAVGLSPPSPPLFGEINRKVPPFWPPARELGLSTRNGSSVQALVLTAAQGAFALTGQAINLPRGRTVAAAQGSFAFTGQAAGLPKGHTVTAAQGSFAFTGQAAGFPKGHTVTAAQGSFAFTGQAVNLVKGHTISAAQGSFAFTGQAVNLPRGRTLAAAQGAFALTGQAAGFPVGHALSAAQGAFAFTGEPVNLVKVSLTIGAALAQPLVPGHFNRRQPPFWPPAREASLSTQNQIPVRTLLAGVGSFGFTGVAIGMPRARTLPMAQGSFALTGQAVNLPRARTLPAVQGSFALTGQPVNLPRGRTLTTAQGAFAFTGQPVGLPRSRTLSAGQGAFAMTGLAAALTWVSGHNKILAATTGFFGFAGRAVGLVWAQSGQGGTALARMHTQRASASLSRMVFVGTKFRASCLFLDFDENLADTTATFTVAGVAQTVVRESVGRYHSDFTPAEAGRFHWQWAGTGTVSAVTEGFFEVLPTEE